MPEEKKDKKEVMNDLVTFDKNSIVESFIPPLATGEYPLCSIIITNQGHRFSFNTKYNNYSGNVMVLGNLDIIRELIQNNMIKNCAPKPVFDEDGELDYIG